jgi:hypothetical protein
VRSKCAVYFSSLVFFLSVGTSLFAQEFAADIYSSSHADNSSSPRIYVEKDKMRVESKERGGRSGAAIINLATQTMDVLIPERQMYMEMAQGQGPGAQHMFSFFRIEDVDNACGQWVKMARKPGGTCHKIGNETVNGRNAVKYEGTNTDGETSQVWIDPKLKFPIKWPSKSDMGELRNIQEGSQPDSIFSIPSGYQKMDMGSMMQQIPPH